jgi:4-hydroxy-tetrahydrodipicolinate synthase
LTSHADQDWRGIFPAICTPFTPDGAIDPDAQRRVARFAIDRGAHGLVCFGLAGEVLKLTADERRALTDAIVEEANGEVPVLVGSGGESVRTARELARHAERAGASGIVLPAPVSARPDHPGLVDYLACVACEVSLPVMIQEAPAYLGVALGPGVVLDVAARATNVRHVKLEAGPAELGRWIRALGEGLAVWGGDGGVYQLDCLRVGAAGIIPGGDLVDLLVEIYEHEARGESDRADVLFARLLPTLVFEMQSIDHYNTCAKHVLARRGVLEHTALRPPAETFAAELYPILDRHLESLDLPALGARPGQPERGAVR